jgi:hypothetical protein
MMIVLLLFLQKQNLATAIYLFLGTLLSVLLNAHHTKYVSSCLLFGGFQKDLPLITHASSTQGKFRKQNQGALLGLISASESVVFCKYEIDHLVDY